MGDAHAPGDRRQQRESLALALRQAAGQVAEAPRFAWDIMLDAGDLSASQFPPDDLEGQVLVDQYRALSGHYREDIYQVAGNHDGDFYDHGAGAWFRKWIDPLGENTATSEVHADLRRFAVEGTWERYRILAGNILILMLSDYNSAPAPVGRGHSREKLKGGFPAGAVRRETFDWWKQQVLENQDKIIITMHHHVLRDTTTRSKRGGGKGFHGTSGGVEGSGYLYFIVEDAAPDHFRYTADAHVFEDFLGEFQRRNGRPAIDLWLGGHSHAMHPEEVYDGQGLTETRWGVVTIQCSALTLYHSGGTPVSRLLTFTPGSTECTVDMYVHDRSRRPAEGAPDSSIGWHAPAARRLQLRQAFVAPAPDTRLAPPVYAPPAPRPAGAVKGKDKGRRSAPTDEEPKMKAK